MMSFLKKSLLMFILIGTVLGAQAQKLSLDYVMQNKKWDKAAELLKAKTKANPSDAMSFLSLGNVYLEKGDMATAKMAFEGAKTAADGGHLGIVADARLALLSGDEEGADKLLAKAEKKSRRKKPNVLRAIGETYAYGKKRDLKKAEELLKNAYSNHPKDYNILLALAYVYKEMPKGGDAVQHYEFAERVNPKSNLTTHMIAKVFWGTRNYEQYEKYLKKAVAKDPNYIPAKRDLADYLYYKKRVQEVTPIYEELVKIPNPLLEDQITLVNCYFLLKDCDKVQKEVPSIIAKNPEVNYLRRLSAYCYFESGDVEKANEIMEEYFQNVPEEKIIDTDYEYRGRIQEALENDSLGIVYYMKALEMNPSNYNLWGKVGKLYYNQKDFCAAGNAYGIRIDSLVANEEEAPSATDYYTLGICKYYCKDNENRYADAEAAFAKVVEMSPTALSGYVWSAKAQEHQDVDLPEDENSPEYQTALAEYGKAKEAHEKVIEIGSEDKEKNKKYLEAAYEYLMFYFYANKDNVNAYKMINGMLEIDPSNEGAVKMKEVLDGESGILPESAPVGGN